MTPAAIIEHAARDGVHLVPSAAGKLKATGNEAAIDRWLPIIRANKVGVLALLAVAADTAEPPPDHPDTRRRRAKALAILSANPALRIAVIAEAGEPAIIGVAIRDKTYGELEIPAPSYDGLALLAMLERYDSETIH